MKRSRNHEAVCGKAALDSVVDTAGIDVCDCDSRATRLSCHCCGEKTNSAGAEYQSCRARDWTCSVDGVDGYREWLKKSCSVEGDMVWEFVAPDSRVVYPLLEGALEVRE
jgi:hypothetical protein